MRPAPQSCFDCATLRSACLLRFICPKLNYTPHLIVVRVMIDPVRRPRAGDGRQPFGFVDQPGKHCAQIQCARAAYFKRISGTCALGRSQFKQRSVSFFILCSIENRPPTDDRRPPPDVGCRRSAVTCAAARADAASFLHRAARRPHRRSR